MSIQHREYIYIYIIYVLHDVRMLILFFLFLISSVARASTHFKET
jgi:hypothetical protein